MIESTLKSMRPALYEEYMQIKRQFIADAYVGGGQLFPGELLRRAGKAGVLYGLEGDGGMERG